MLADGVDLALFQIGGDLLGVLFGHPGRLFVVQHRNGLQKTFYQQHVGLDDLRTLAGIGPHHFRAQILDQLVEIRNVPVFDTFLQFRGEAFEKFLQFLALLDDHVAPLGVLAENLPVHFRGQLQASRFDLLQRLLDDILNGHSFTPRKVMRDTKASSALPDPSLIAWKRSASEMMARGCIGKS